MGLRRAEQSLLRHHILQDGDERISLGLSTGGLCFGCFGCCEKVNRKIVNRLRLGNRGRYGGRHWRDRLRLENWGRYGRRKRRDSPRFVGAS